MLSSALLLLAAAVPSWAQSQMLFAAKNGKCQTVVDCGGDSGPNLVTTLTTTLGVNFHPTTTLTLPATSVLEGQTTTIWIVLPSNSGHATVTSTLSPGILDFSEVPTPEPGAPATVWILQAGPKPSDQRTTTITTTIPHLPPTNTPMILPGREPPPGGDVTHFYIPAIGEQVTATSWTCPCANSEAAKTVTVTRQPEAPTPTTSVTEDGKIEEKAPSKFACSKDDLSPCRGTQLMGWKTFAVNWNAAYPRPGPPAPFTFSSDYNDETILTVTDDEYQAEHWTVRMDGQVIGESHEDGWKNDKLYCGKNADDCIAKGYSHGSFLIPKGKHELSFQWTDGPYKTDAGYNWWYGAGQYRFDKQCTC